MEYLEKFCQDFIDDIKSSIDKSITKDESPKLGDLTTVDVINESQKSDWLLEEVTHHALFAQKKSESFHGRKKLIGREAKFFWLHSLFMR